MNTTIVIYHRADFDGLASGAIAKRNLGASANYLPWDYNMDTPDLSPYSMVYLIDISLPPDVMRANAAKIVWLDHHISKIKELADTSFVGLQIDGIAACRLAWQWFNGDRAATKADYIARTVEEPYAVQLLGEFDVWRRDNPDTDPFQFGLQSVKDVDWATLFGDNDGRLLPRSADYVADVIEKGKSILEYMKVTNAQIAIERGFDVTFEGLLFRALNTARSNSLTFEAALRPEHDGCLSYYWNGTKWGFSLYGVPGKPDIDLSVIAVKYGGGGHKQACGGTFATLPKELGGNAS